MRPAFPTSRSKFRNNEVRLQLHALAYNLGNFLRTLALFDGAHGEFSEQYARARKAQAELRAWAGPFPVGLKDLWRDASDGLLLIALLFLEPFENEVDVLLYRIVGLDAWAAGRRLG